MKAVAYNLLFLSLPPESIKQEMGGLKENKSMEMIAKNERFLAKMGGLDSGF